jgi:hypothetical protein
MCFTCYTHSLGHATYSLGFAAHSLGLFIHYGRTKLAFKKTFLRFDITDADYNNLPVLFMTHSKTFDGNFPMKNGYKYDD